MKKIWVFSLLLLFSSSASLADDSATFDWSGWYFGASGGYADGRTRTLGVSGSPWDQTFGEGYGVSVGPNGGFYGGQFGYNVMNGPWVTGIEVDIGYLDLSDEQLEFPNAPNNLDDTGIQTNYGWYGDAAVRLGYATGNFLIYGKAGIAAADLYIKAGDLDSGSFDDSDTTVIDSTEVGFVAGGGLEYGITRSMSVKAEYLFMDFGNISSTDPDGNGYSSSANLHTVKGGINFHF